MINREDMLELTRRMTPARYCFNRIAGAYLDEEGFVDGTFNTNFRKLSEKEIREKLEIAKTIPFAKTNENLKEYAFSVETAGAGSVRQLLCAMREHDMKDDGLLDVFYEVFEEKTGLAKEHAILMFHGTYDIPVKAKDKEWLEGSEEIYDFIICAVSPLEGEYEPKAPVFGFMFPAFSDHSQDDTCIDLFHADGYEDVEKKMIQMFGVSQT